PIAVPMAVPSLEGTGPLTPSAGQAANTPFDATRFDRQVRAFGPEFQSRIVRCRVGVVGVGGLGSVMVELLARLGVRDWVLVDPDRVEPSNLNRLLGATARDAGHRTPKIDVAARAARAIDRQARVRRFRCSVFAPRALRALKGCDLIIATTDNAASRLVLNAL